ncbi:hypothetical protein F5Y05DRAFT_276292 [Hypoxylon sp. FL0543]|nr:hypothetical protein F5Y05DRAFT_276292 [Hypoxylon sp. FL0543]
MPFQTAVRLLALAGANAATAQIYLNGPFQLHVGSLLNTSINGHAYPCNDTNGLCFIEGAPATLPPKEGFFFTSRVRADYTTGYLTWRNETEPAAPNATDTVTDYGSVGLIYDPGTNVAVPIFNQTHTPETLGFDAGTGNLMMAGIDDTAMSSSGGGDGNGNGTGDPNGGARGRNYNNWYLCFVQLDESKPPETLVSWVLGANLGWPPTNPTCQPINITMETIAVGYGNPI